MVETNLKYARDPQLLLDIVSAMPRRVDNTLNTHRTKILGNFPKHRDEFQPETLLRRMEGGGNILVMDSKTDLPPRWRVMDVRREYGGGDTNHFNVGQPDTDTQSSGLSGDEVPDSAGELRVGGHSDVELHDDDDYDDGVDVEEEGYPANGPKRVLLFTTVMMLGLLAKCKWASVDGTFKSSSRQWKQLFVMLCNYQGTWLPIAFGWLPDKSFASYQIFLILLLEAFRNNSTRIQSIYGRNKLKVKKVKMDFEVNIIRAFDTLFVIKGCLFHFSQAGTFMNFMKFFQAEHFRLPVL